MKTGPNGWMTLATMAALSLPLSMTNGARAAGTASVDPGVIGDVTVFGSGCPNGTSRVAMSADRTEISIAFDSFIAAAAKGKSRSTSACNVTIPVQVPAGMSVGIVRGDFEGTATIPNVTGAGAQLTREYFFTGTQGPRQATSFPLGYNDAFILADSDAIVTWSACGEDVNARESVSIIVGKPAAASTVAVSVQSMSLRLAWRQCE
jgi:hypothetical protein